MEAIPRVVHVTWKTRTLPDWGADCVATFGRRHADYELRIWSDEDVAALVAAADDAALAATYARPCGAARADLARLLILRAHGASTRTWTCTTRPRSSRTVSVITPTTSQRQKFHAALYASFAEQRYSDRELVVVDSGADPSPFFDWLCDARVTYVFVRCARGGPSIGAKRNFAAALAAGDVLAHFDDDDAYGPSYVGTMRRALRRRGALAAKLSSWFVVDASRAGAAPAVFYFDGARTGPRRAVLSFGFSLVYRRAALDLCGGFPDADWGEDAAFLRKLVAAAPEARALAFHRDVAGVCAHVLHPGNRSRETEVAACGAVDATWLATESDVAPLVGPYLAARGGAPRRSPRFLARARGAT
ncbi:hypothetical protein JL721_11106 [Aureococcus anophagefferens]|nr:hypothetical protein JL721_11106 [Aureococcus anophagefferens]